jgi:hypothetical protein
MRDSMDVGTTKPFSGPAVLTSFNLKFANGDHKLRRVAVMPKGATATLSFSDQNGDDPFNASATWASFLSTRPVPQSTVNAFGGGRFDIPLGEPVAGRTLCLSGFEFRRRDGMDANVRSIGVWLTNNSQGKPVARVMLMDDQGPDFRGFETTLGVAFGVAAVPFGVLGGTTATIVDALSRTASFDERRYRAYSVSVSYAWIPNTAVVASSRFTGTSRTPSSGRVLPTHGAIQGFEYYFGNSDHHLLSLGVRPGRTEAIAFQDNDRDDPITWALQMAELKDPVKAP